MRRRESGISQDARGWREATAAAVAVAMAVVVVVRQRLPRKRDARGEGNLLRVRLCVSFISTDIIMALRGRS